MSKWLHSCIRLAYIATADIMLDRLHTHKHKHRNTNSLTVLDNFTVALS